MSNSPNLAYAIEKITHHPFVINSNKVGVPDRNNHESLKGLLAR